jgi:hypothetical protein
MKLYIVARPYDEIEEFIPMYITTYEDKARTFLKWYSDESIQMVIFSKEWNPEDPKGSPNILFNYLDGDLTYKQDTTEKNTLYGKYKEWLEMDEEEAELYMFGDPDVERDKNGMMNVKIWNLDGNKIS